MYTNNGKRRFASHNFNSFKQLPEMIKPVLSSKRPKPTIFSDSAEVAQRPETTTVSNSETTELEQKKKELIDRVMAIPLTGKGWLKLLLIKELLDDAIKNSH